MPGQYVTYQDYIFYKVRSSSVLTNGYIAGNIIGNNTDFPQGGVHLNNQLVLLINFTIGNLTSADIKIEVSADNVTYYQLLAPSTFTAGSEAINLDTIHLTASSTFAYSIPIKYRYIKVSALGTGTVTNSLLAIDSIIGVA